MDKELKILIVEDVPADVVLMNHELRHGGLRFRSKRVETKEEFIRELHQDVPDLILSDHGLPAFDGYTALAIAQDKCPDVPFIFVTGSLGEEVTIKTFESGATDYVLKNRLSRLAPVVQRALREADHRAKRKEAERALQESEERFRTLVEGVKDYAIFMLTEEGLISSWNSGAEWIKGYRMQEILGQHFSIFYPADVAAAGIPQKHLAIAKTEGRFEEEGLRVGKSGNTFWASVVISALNDEHGQFCGFAHVTRDINERIKAQAELLESETRKAAILDTALDAIISMDHHGNILEWNTAAEKMFGYSREEALGKKMAELIIPERLRHAHYRALEHYLATGRGNVLRHRVEMSALHRDGWEFPVELAITDIPGDGNPTFTGYVHDITERARAAEQLRKSEELFRMLVEKVKDYAIYMLDPEGHVASWNAGAERNEGYAAEEIIGRHCACLFPREEIAEGKPECILKEAVNQGQYEDEGWRLRKDGSRYWASVLLTALRDESGKLYGFSHVSRDMTEQKQAEEEIHRLNAELERRVVERTAQLEEANKELEAFSYSVSHDLRAPLRHIDGFGQILKREAMSKLNEEEQHHLETITSSAKQMGQLIDDLLAFSRMSRAEMRKTAIDLNELVHSVQYDLRKDMEGRKVEWNIGQLPKVMGDPALLRQVLYNLFSNALKYSRQTKVARIHVRGKVVDDEAVVSVADNGVGFDMKYVHKLFGVFQRLHRASEFEGNGIGLGNVRRIIQRHGGRTWAEGAVGKGATFYFSLPLYPDE